MDEQNTKTILVRSTILALILAGPSLGVFMIVHYIFDNILTAGLAGGIVHFIALGFSMKIYKKLTGIKI